MICILKLPVTTIHTQLPRRKHFFSNFTLNKCANKIPKGFFSYQVLNRTLLASPTLGPVQSHIFIALAAAWIIVFFGVFKGIGSIGWAVTFTATVPYLLVIFI